jgi:hypothetical protein
MMKVTVIEKRKTNARCCCCTIARGFICANINGNEKDICNTCKKRIEKGLIELD